MDEQVKTRAGFSRRFLAFPAVLALLAAVVIAISALVMNRGIPAENSPTSTMSILGEITHELCRRLGLGGPARNSCFNCLRQIDGAKEQWALENKMSAGTPVVASEIDAYIKGGAPKCEKGGTYTYGAVGEAPKCSIRGHTI